MTATSPYDMNALVHEKVMGFCVHQWGYDYHERQTYCARCPARYGFVVHMHTPLYSHDLNMAWLVVEKLRETGEYVTITPSIKNARGYTVSRSKALNPHGDGTADGWDNTQDSVVVTAPSAAYGICLVAVAEYLPEGALDEYQE